MYKIGYINTRGKRDSTGVGSYRSNLYSNMECLAVEFNLELKQIIDRRKFEKIFDSFIIPYRGFDLIHFEPDLHWYAGSWLTKLFSGSTKIAVTIHGTSPLLFPELVPKKQTVRVEFLKRISWAIDGIFTVSEIEKETIVKNLNLNESKVYVTYNGNNMLKLKQENLGDAINFPYKRDYILHVSNNTPWHKRPKLLIKSFKKTADKFSDIDLIIVGDRWKTKSITKLISDLGLEKRIFRLGHKEQKVLPQYYQNAILYLQTSRYESFGLPVVEAMTFGVPVISTRAHAVPEVAKGGALFAEDDSTSISNAIEQVLLDDKLYEQLSRQGEKIAERYTWEKTAKKTMKSYIEIIENN